MLPSLASVDELTLLAVCVLDDDAYAAAIVQEIESRIGRPILLGTVHKALARLEDGGLLTSELGGSSPVRGGRRKRLYTPTAFGVASLKEAQQARQSMWSRAPRLQEASHE